MSQGHPVTRRSFLRAGTAVGLGAAGCDAGAGEGVARPDAGDSQGERTPEAGAEPDAAAREPASTAIDAGDEASQQDDATDASTENLIGVAGLVTIEQSVRRAVALAGGLSAIRPGQTVFIKPNAVHGGAGHVPSIVTHNEVVAAVVRLVKERDPGHIIVGDRSARLAGPSEPVFDAIGLTQAALEAGADEVYPAPLPRNAPDEWVLTQLPLYEESWQAQGGVLLMRKLIEADHIINLPTCKNHEWAVYSLCMKNFIGGIGDDSRDALHYRLGDPLRLSRDIALLNQGFVPLMNVVDATSVMINGGPSGTGDNAVRVDKGLIFAGKDRLAVDAACVSLIQLELSRNLVAQPDPTLEYLTGNPAWQLPQLLEGLDLGLNLAPREATRLVFDDGVDDARDIEANFRAG